MEFSWLFNTDIQMLGLNPTEQVFASGQLASPLGTEMVPTSCLHESSPVQESCSFLTELSSCYRSQLFHRKISCIDELPLSEKMFQMTLSYGTFDTLRIFDSLKKKFCCSLSEFSNSNLLIDCDVSI